MPKQFNLSEKKLKRRVLNASEGTERENQHSGGAVMVARCSNPSCSAPFRSLQDGRLFLLGVSTSNQTEHFWLCGCCSSTMTLRIGEEDTVVAVSILEPIRGVPDDVAFVSLDRKRGLMPVALALHCDGSVEMA